MSEIEDNKWRSISLLSKAKDLNESAAAEDRALTTSEAEEFDWLLKRAGELNEACARSLAKALDGGSLP